MSDFPSNSLKEDASFFGEEHEDVTVRGEVEGGYIITRPRHTRLPRRTFETGFSDLSQVQLGQVITFAESKRGGLAFTYTHPTSGVEYTVRFKGAPKPTYKGIADNPRWDVAVTLEQI